MRESSAKPLGVVIPTYNRADALSECLSCLENQSCKEFEVVVVDDGSTDSTQQMMERYSKNSPLAIRYVKQKNSGPAKARNLAISMLETPVCLMIGDDIFASPTLIEQHLAFHLAQPGLKFGALGWTQWSTSGQTITPFMKWLGESPVQFAYKDLLAGVQPDWRHFYTSNLSVKTELLKAFPFNETFPYAAVEDIELGYRIQKQHGLNIEFLPRAVAYHLHPTTFRQSCERMVRVGYSWAIFHDLWPEQNVLHRTRLKQALFAGIRVIAQSPRLTALLVSAADLSTRIRCPNNLMRAADYCKYEIGYRRYLNQRTRGSVHNEDLIA